MTEKSLRERLSENSGSQNAQRATIRLAKFLKLWKEVEEAFRDGWSYMDIWRVLHRDGEIDFSYSSFLNFVRKIKRRQLDHEKERTRKPNGAAAQASATKQGGGKGELPLFGKETPPREPRRF